MQVLELVFFWNLVNDEPIINDHILDYVEDEKDMPTMSQLTKDIAYEVTRKIGKPQTQKDVMVWKRHAKSVGYLILTFLKTKQNPSARILQDHS